MLLVCDMNVEVTQKMASVLKRLTSTVIQIVLKNNGAFPSGQLHAGQYSMLSMDWALSEMGWVLLKTKRILILVKSGVT